MAVAHDDLTSGGTTTTVLAGNTVATASIAPTAGDVLTLFFTGGGSADQADPTGVTGLSGTWVKREAQLWSTVASPTRASSMWTCDDWTGTGEVTITAGSDYLSCAWVVTRSSSVDPATNDGIVQTVDEVDDATTADAITATLAALGSTDARGLFAAFVNGTETIAWDAPQDELVQVDITGPAHSISVAWDDLSTTVAGTATWTNQQAAIIAAEYKALVAGGVPVRNLSLTGAGV